jgi:uncharacterized protein (DUF924 family)
VLDFWFGPLSDGIAAPAQRQRWFAGGADFDAEIGARFGSLIDAAAAGELNDWRATPQGVLAFVLVTDQFSRQVFRGTARAFATDGLALAAAWAAVAKGDDRRLGIDERAFLYLPFEHSEAITDQDESVRLFGRLHDGAPTAARAFTASYLSHATAHREIIARFGRFPHRNSALGRASTPEEALYLETASGFGQTTGR